MEYILLVTWFFGSQAATSYQVNFATRQACESALSLLKDDASRLGSPESTIRTPSGPLVSPGGSPSSPILSAICVNQR